MKDLIILTSHLDDFELGCVGFIIKHYNEYKNIFLYVATNNDYKEPITLNNIIKINNHISKDIKYSNFNYGATKLKTQFDELKDEFYKLIDFRLFEYGCLAGVNVYFQYILLFHLVNFYY